METQEAKPVQLETTKEITLPRLKIDEYVGRKAHIENVQEYQGRYGYFLKIETDVLETVQLGGKTVPLRASRIFGLHTDEHNVVGWGRDTVLGKYLRKMSVNHYKELVGREVVVQAMTNRDGMDFLTFN